MKRFFRTFKSRLPANVLPRLVYLVIRAIYATMRVKTVGSEHCGAYYQRGEGLIHVFWHGRMVIAPFAYRGNGLHILISSHGDGELIARVMQLFGFQLVRGSSTKGGREAIHDLFRLVRRNHDVAITPDGPQGPPYVVKSGVAQLAKRSGRAVIPFAFSASRGKEFGSWDRFFIPYPFSRGVYVWGEPLVCGPDEDLESFRCRIERAMLETLAKADNYFRP